MVISFSSISTVFWFRALIDQYNGDGATELNNLIADKIPGIPSTIAEFDFSANYAHRNYTHRGWNVTCYSDTSCMSKAPFS